jgi:hypothetical protein
MSNRFVSSTQRDHAASGEPAAEAVSPGAQEAHGSDAGASGAVASTPATEPLTATPREEASVDLSLRRDELTARFAELQYDLGGLLYEMAIRDHIRVDVLVRQAAVLQDVDAELREVERILLMEETGTAGSCGSCGAPHSGGAVYCWQCGQPLLQHVASHTIGA